MQELREVYSLHETQRREAVVGKQDDDGKLARIRHDDAAKMREAALERHKLLQQIEALSNANNMSDQALVSSHAIYLFTSKLYCQFIMLC